MRINATSPTPRVDIHARNVALDKAWLQAISDRTLQLDRFGNGIRSFEIEVTHNPNPSRQAKAWRVEIAAHLLNHSIRATGVAAEPEPAFFEAREILESSLRRASRRMHWSRHGRRATRKIAAALDSTESEG